MKQIKSDKMFEKKIRIYDIRFMEELNDFYQKHSREYGNINEFFTSLIRTGLQVQKVADKNYGEYAGKFESLSDKLTEIQNEVKDSNRGIVYNLKDLICTMITTQKVLLRIYNMVLANNESLPLNNQFVKAGFYDLLPDDLEEIEKEMKKLYADKYFAKDENK